jgi:hypothetical protein
MDRNPFWKISNYYWAHTHNLKNFNALHKQLFLFTHHKRDIFHFLVVSPLCYPVVLPWSVIPLCCPVPAGSKSSSRSPVVSTRFVSLTPPWNEKGETNYFSKNNSYNNNFLVLIPFNNINTIQFRNFNTFNTTGNDRKRMNIYKCQLFCGRNSLEVCFHSNYVLNFLEQRFGL